MRGPGIYEKIPPPPPPLHKAFQFNTEATNTLASDYVRGKNSVDPRREHNVYVSRKFALITHYFLLFVMLSLFKASTHLIWSVFGLTNLETMESQDELSTAVVGVLYVMFLILSVIMLVNMLVALLTNTYNKVEVSIYIFFLPFL